eukprot:TRINITY_DN2981_c0_g1_i1.p1 TRINITY_DN2981_c0_g1~~TRINITY_DN2981_c0_g1_i1.p1  ORF type:complete len:162 (-),score=50.34 TRINITY_DN2981_c0_g1_i1:169-654(-)
MILNKISFYILCIEITILIFLMIPLYFQKLSYYRTILVRFCSKQFRQTIISSLFYAFLVIELILLFDAAKHLLEYENLRKQTGIQTMTTTSLISSNLHTSERNLTIYTLVIGLALLIWFLGNLLCRVSLIQQSNRIYLKSNSLKSEISQLQETVEQANRQK